MNFLLSIEISLYESDTMKQHLSLNSDPLNLFIKKIVFILFMLNLTHCPKNPDIGILLNERIKEPYDKTVTFPVYFATNRMSIPGAMESCSGKYFSSTSMSSPRYGNCLVNVPSSHNIGSLDTDPRGERDKFFAFLGFKSYSDSDFFEKIEKSKVDEVLVFIHGFNVGFEEAILRAAQIQYDVKFQGNTIVFTWPAGREDDSVLGNFFLKETYEKNYNEALASRKLFIDFLFRLKNSGKKIHLVVHSMGHQVVLPGLVEITKSTKDPVIQELILNAPDFDSGEFRKIGEDLKKSSRRITIYCSPGDNALVASKKVNGGMRAGMCMRYPGMDVINVNEVDDPVLGVGGLGHGYYSSRPLLTDIYQVLLGISVEKRLFIRKSGPHNGEDYVLRK